jgi:hypothetical protein
MGSAINTVGIKYVDIRGRLSIQEKFTQPRKKDFVYEKDSPTV